MSMLRLHKEDLKTVRFFLILPVLFFLTLEVNAEPQPWPSPANYVSDFANVISQNQERALNGLFRQVQTKTEAQLAIVTIHSLRKRGFGSIDETAVNLFEQWGIGGKEKDEGLLILVAIEERKWRVEVGYGLEGTIPDVIASRLGETLLVSSFRKGRYGEGLTNLSVQLIARIAKEKNIPLSEFNLSSQAARTQRSSRRSHAARPSNVFGGIVHLIIAALMLVFFIRNPKLFLLWMLLGGGRHRGGHWRGGSHFGGGFGGGGGSSFGGFGGGMSGGGGASGSW